MNVNTALTTLNMRSKLSTAKRLRRVPNESGRHYQLHSDQVLARKIKGAKPLFSRCNPKTHRVHRTVDETKRGHSSHFFIPSKAQPSNQVFSHKTVVCLLTLVEMGRSETRNNQQNAACAPGGGELARARAFLVMVVVGVFVVVVVVVRKGKKEVLFLCFVRGRSACVVFLSWVCQPSMPNSFIHSSWRSMSSLPTVGRAFLRDLRKSA